MLLEKLCEYASRLEDVPPFMYQRTVVSWFIDLDNEGRLIGFVPLSGEEGIKRKGKEMITPHIMRAVAIRPKLLADTGEYVLGIGREESNVERVRKCHAQFRSLVNQLAEATEEPSVRAVAGFLADWSSDTVQLPEGFDPGDILTFRVEGCPQDLPIFLESVKSFWSEYTTTGEGAIATEKRQCIICGKTKPTLERLAFKVKGIPGGQPAGTAIISANVPAIESYGATASLIAPTCHECGEAFTLGLNSLISNEKTRLFVGPLLFVFWTKEETDFSPASFFSNPDPEEVKNLILSYKKGQLSEPESQNSFYAAALSGSGGRAVVRSWVETTVGEVKKNLARWFQLQRLVGPWGDESEPEKLRNMAASLYKDPRKDMPPNVPKMLVKVALEGGRLPDWLLYQAARRNKAEQRVTRPRMVLTKMILVSDQDLKATEDKMASLDIENRDSAYLSGRLLAVIESVQRAALPTIKATIIDRYYGTASTAPAAIFGTLLRGAQNHLAVLRKTKEGTFHALSRRLEDVLKVVDANGFPATLNLKEQALFSLGYYHQKAADRADAIARKQHRDDSITV